jgi:hypothetical protein
MIYLGIVFLIVGIIGWAFARAMPSTHPISTLAMYAGLGIGIVLLIVGILVYATHGDAIQIDSAGRSPSHDCRLHEAELPGLHGDDPPPRETRDRLRHRADQRRRLEAGRRGGDRVGADRARRGEGCVGRVPAGRDRQAGGMKWEFCPGRYHPPAAAYAMPNGQARGACAVCGHDGALISGNRMRHHFREKATVIA